MYIHLSAATTREFFAATASTALYEFALDSIQD